MLLDRPEHLKSLRKNYVRFPLDLKPDVLERFLSICLESGTTPTTEIKRFIAEYCEQDTAASRVILGLRAAGWPEIAINDFILWIETGDEQYKPAAQP